MEGAQNHLYIIWNNIKTRVVVGLITQRSGPLETVIAPFILKLYWDLYYKQRPIFILKTKRVGSYTLIEAHFECVILNLKGKNQETLILIF